MSTRRAGVIAVLCAAVLVCPAPAAAGPPERFSEQIDAVNPAECGDMRVRYQGSVHGTFQIRERRGVELAQETFHERLRITNLATGRFVNYEVNGIGKDLRVRDNGDGTLSILAAFTGIETLRAADGRVLVRAAGTTRRELRIDTMGTEDPGDDVVVDERVVKESGIRGSGLCVALRAATA